MKNTFTFLLVLFTFSGLFGQTDCKVKILYSMNKSLPPSYTFKTDPQPEGVKYSWSFGDKTYSDSPSPTHSFKITDAYAVTVKIIGADGKVCYGELKERFEGETVTTPPSTIISGKGKVKNMASTTGCGLVIALENGNILVPVEIVPNFLLKEGQYLELAYELFRDKPSGCSAGVSAKIHKIAEIVQSECKAYFTATNKLWSDPTMMKKMVFANLSTGDIKECLWNFGDNTTSTELRPTHEYAAFGEYKVCLVITTASGCKSDYCATIKVEGIPVVTGCKFDLVVKPKPETPNSFLFYAISPAEIKTWSWNFGDGHTSDSKNPEHAYEKTGTYEVSCTVTTHDGCTEKRSIRHTVLAAPLKTCAGAINLTLYDPTDNKCNGKAIAKLLDENGAEVSNVKYLWSNGQTASTAENLCPDKSYTVQAIIDGTCQKNTSFTLLSKPIWRATTINGQSNFTVISPKEGVQYEWNFGNGKTLTGVDVNYNFEKDGVYDVKLKASSGSDFSEYSQQVVVLKSITGNTIINKSELRIAPNPVTEMLKINLGNPVKGNFNIEIMNMAGQKVYSQLLNVDGLSQTEINVQHLKSGIYFLRITNNQLLIDNRKFIKVN
ncbi:MAG: PKD domain-containing protein [Bacteroidota bacterium]|nr:PKD domain-containing protein [Bacteroidota bacterium]